MEGKSIVKRLLIRASNNYDEDFKTIPVNTNVGTEIASDIGVFNLIVNIKNFDGSMLHLDNSKYNVNDRTYINGTEAVSDTEPSQETYPNLQLQIKFKPKVPIRGSNLLFGNDFNTPIRNYVPTTILSAGLKFFTWFINKTVKGDIYNDKPFLYGLVLNSMTYLSILKDKDASIGKAEDIPKNAKITDTLNFKENLNSNIDNVLDIPDNSIGRRKFFGDLSKCENFVFNEDAEYMFQFDTNFLKLGDSQYSVSIPTYGNKTFDINVSLYANEHLNNFNWVIKKSGYEGVGYGDLGLVLNFALLDEDPRD